MEVGDQPVMGTKTREATQTFAKSKEYKTRASPGSQVFFSFFISIFSNSYSFALKMYALSLLIAVIGMVAAAPSVDVEARQAVQVASVDRYAGSGCTGTICV